MNTILDASLTKKQSTILTSFINKEAEVQTPDWSIETPNKKDFRTLSSIVRKSVETYLPEFELFANWKEEHSPNTKERYRITLTAFFVWLYGVDLLYKYEDRTLEEEDLDNFKKYLVQRTKKKDFQKISINTANSYLTSVRRFFKFMEWHTRRDEVSFRNIASHLDNIKPKSNKKHRRKSLSLDQTKDLYQYCKNRSTREAFIIHLMASQGLRVSSIYYLNAGDVTIESGVLGAYVFLKGKATFDEDGNPLQEDYIFKPFNNHTKEAYLEYIKEVTLEDEDPLFFSYSANSRKQRLSKVSIRKIAKEAFYGIGVLHNRNSKANKQYSAHSLRHTFVTNLRRKGATTEEARIAADHESVITTEKYDHSLSFENRIQNPIENVLNTI